MTWTRRLSLRLGHTTAAASTGVAAFMGGLALQLYPLIEFLVVLIAPLPPALPLGTTALLLAWSTWMAGSVLP